MHYDNDDMYSLKVDIEVLSLASFGRVFQIDIMFGKEEF